jgi:hypothetical protein
LKFPGQGGGACPNNKAKKLVCFSQDPGLCPDG